MIGDNGVAGRLVLAMAAKWSFIAIPLAAGGAAVLVGNPVISTKNPSLRDYSSPVPA
jgi:hypothetical protein